MPREVATIGDLISTTDWRSQSSKVDIFGKIYDKGEIADFWEKYATLSPKDASLTPEVNLKLLFNTGSGIFKGGDCETEPLISWSLHNPYSWQCYWPGGQGLARYILDHPQVVAGKTVLEVGSGCGAVSIACAIAGAAEVVANDIDPVAAVATELNAFLNGVSGQIRVTTENLLARFTSALKIDSEAGASFDIQNLGVNNLVETSSKTTTTTTASTKSSSTAASSHHRRRRWDVVLLGDMQYNDELSRRVRHWIAELTAEGVDVLFGDPGRSTVDEDFLSSRSVVRVAEFDLPLVSKRSHVNPSDTAVWKVS